MKGALCYSDYLRRNGLTYARELQTKRFGEGMDDLRRRQSVLRGSEQHYWCVVTCKRSLHSQNFSARHMEGGLSVAIQLQRSWALVNQCTLACGYSFD